ncbi:hypothetical protein AEB_P1282 [Altererythrobacter sp. B11]|uniref:hypothetical protein n=1 Tax=Altererythrobacter sp. B11 TaxID=2060312 RepID=UPI000DC725EC|nr:hypothetical protein [Altererythrobacter sp. B11]BBC72150.1 hypothetical protein AEB_P1282 [Altererythrobacter sp. B11]
MHPVSSLLNSLPAAPAGKSQPAANGAVDGSATSGRSFSGQLRHADEQARSAQSAAPARADSGKAGTPVPPAGQTGKKLPVAGKDEEPAADTAPAEEETTGGEAAEQSLIDPALLALGLPATAPAASDPAAAAPVRTAALTDPAAIANAVAGLESAARDAGAAATPAPAAAAAPAPAATPAAAAQKVPPFAQDAMAEGDTAARPTTEGDSKPAEKAAPSVTLRLAERSGEGAAAQQGQTGSEADAGTGSAPKSTASAPAQSELPQLVRPFHAPAAEQVSIAAGPAAPATPAAPAHLAAPQSAQPQQDLDAIVERLAAARQILAPAKAELSIDHREFGELSLRFDQRRDGTLAVDITARDIGAHRAVAAAMASDRGHFASNDQSASSGGQGHGSQARSATSDRGNQQGGHSGHGAPGQDQPRGRAAARPAPAAPARGGIYA